MKIVRVILLVGAGLALMGFIRYLFMSKAKKVFLKQQLKALPEMLPRYFV
jgi:hypothetical protein